MISSEPAPSIDVNIKREEELTHKVYDAALDNSLWPEMILSIADHVNALEQLPDQQADQNSIQTLNSHFNRAYDLSERIVGLQEDNYVQSKVLGALSCDVTLFDRNGQVFFSNQFSGSDALIEAKKTPEIISVILASFIDKCEQSGQVQIWTETEEHDKAFMLLPHNEALKLGFPARVDKVLISHVLETSNAIDQFAASYKLKPAEVRFMTEFTRTSNIRIASETLGLTYETARKYLKDIFIKSGITSQSELMKTLLFSPAVLITKPNEPMLGHSEVRRLITLASGNTLEYFSLGPDDGYPVLFFDALTGSAIDVVGNPNRYLPVLNKLGMRLITVCRPGSFQSSYRPLQSVKDYAEDVAELCDQLDLQKISLLSYSYGSNAALGVAHELPHLVNRITMSSVSYTAYNHENWREMDFFFQITNVIGRRWPALLHKLIPFLARSIMQNIDRFTDRSVSRAQCDHERAVLLTPEIRERSRAMLMERTAAGMDGLIEEYRLNAQPLGFGGADISVPMTLLHGEHDIINPLGGAKLLATEAPNATLHILPGMAHHHIFAEWDWIFRAAMGIPFDIPEPSRRGIYAPEQQTG